MSNDGLRHARDTAQCPRCQRTLAASVVADCGRRCPHARLNRQLQHMVLIAKAMEYTDASQWIEARINKKETD